ncbi:glycosyltransferase [Orrella sp. 11846]|uniref:glycosyltransferase n=1 Tax=Orrella sp. 11846 TaxID=3409913 RepID=UPI003B5B3240
MTAQTKLQATVVAAFYNDFEVLRLLMRALNAQADGCFELIIADDGSRAEVIDAITAIKGTFDYPVRHLWQEDAGFLKTQIMNEAVRQARGQTLIFVDADCVVQDGFVQDHLRCAGPGVIQTGRRIDVFREATKHLDCSQASRIVKRNFWTLLWWTLRGKARNLEKAIRLPQWFRNRFQGRTWGVLGCNFSVQREELLAVNGFDERHGVQWGAEDSDIERRLRKTGAKVLNLRYAASMVHFDGQYFKRGPSEDARNRWKLYLQAEQEDRVWTPDGILKEDRDDASVTAQLQAWRQTAQDR